jgi:hypothetical protein
MSKRIVAASAVLLLIAAAWFWLRPSWSALSAAEPAPAPAARSAPAAAPGTIVDPLNPDRPVQLDQTRPTSGNGWLQARPAFQYSKSTADRAGVEPCATQAVDTSGLEDWTPLSRGHFTAPRSFALGPSGDFDLVIHLHGDEPVRRELVESRQQFVLYTVTLDVSQSYAPLFNGARMYEALVAEIEQTISKKAGKPAHAAHVALSAWSAGFVGIEAALGQPVGRDVDAVILIDGLHAPRGDRGAFEAQLKPFVDYARRAATGERFMFISHSSIDPGGFASTTECAHHVIAALGGRPQPVRRADAMGLELVEYFSRADFHVRGYAGNDKPDHCAQLALLRDAFAALGRRWARR